MSTETKKLDKRPLLTRTIDFIDDASAAIQHPTATADERLSKIRKSGETHLPDWLRTAGYSNIQRASWMARQLVEQLSQEWEQLVRERDELLGFKMEAARILDERNQAIKERERALAACSEMQTQVRAALDAWKTSYESELRKCDEQIRQCKGQGDQYGVNFHSGRKSGFIGHDIALQLLKDASKAVKSELECHAPSRA